MSENQRILTCVYCGHEYPAGTPPHGNELLTAHIAVCDKHPMKAIIEDRDLLLASYDELLQMLANIMDQRDELLAACQAVVVASQQANSEERFGKLVSELAMEKICDAIARAVPVGNVAIGSEAEKAALAHRIIDRWATRPEQLDKLLERLQSEEEPMDWKPGDV